MAETIKFEYVNNAGTKLVTIDFMEEPAIYRITHWEPAVAVRRSDGLGGRAYEDVVEEMTISIINPTPGVSATSQYLHALQQMFDQAIDWERGDPVSPVLLHYQAHSSSDAVVVVVKGPISPGKPMILLPPGHTISEATGNIDGVKLRFRRSGLWLGSQSNYVDENPPGANPSVQVISFGEIPAAASPFVLKMNNLPLQELVHDSFILVGQGVSILDADQDLPGSGTFAVATDTINKARDGKVMRFTPINTSWATRLFNQGLWVTSARPGHTYGIFFNYRNNSGSTSFQVQFDTFTAQTRVTLIPAGVNDPKWVYGGTVSTPRGELVDLRIRIKASAASGTLDIDSIAILNLSTPDARAIAVSQLFYGATNGNLTIDHLETQRPAPAVYWVNQGFPYGYTGNIHLWTDYKQIRVAWLATRDNFWRATDNSDNPLALQFTATLMQGYTVP
jgi:hypothetical protein